MRKKEPIAIVVYLDDAGDLYVEEVFVEARLPKLLDEEIEDFKAVVIRGNKLSWEDRT